MHDSNGGAQTKDVGQKSSVEIDFVGLWVVAGVRECLESNDYVSAGSPLVKPTQQSNEQSCRGGGVKVR